MLGSRDLPLEDLTTWELMELLRSKSLALQVWDQADRPRKLAYQHDGRDGLGDKVWHHLVGKPVHRLYFLALLTAEDHKCRVLAFGASLTYRPALGLQPIKKPRRCSTVVPLQLMDGDEEDVEIMSEQLPPKSMHSAPATPPGTAPPQPSSLHEASAVAVGAPLHSS